MPKNKGDGIPYRIIVLISEKVATMGVNGFANASGISPALVSRYLNNKIGEPTTATLQKLADYFQETFIIEIKPRGKG